jgi:hypothetical protein
MSNTSTVTPYESTNSEELSTAGLAAGAGIAACVVGAVAVVRWLVEETAEERESLDNIRRERRREQLAHPGLGKLADERRVSPSITTVSLHLNDADSLIRSAEHLGYRRESVAPSSASLSDQPVLLRNTTGERLAIGRNDKGRLIVSTAGSNRRVQKLVRQHTVDRAVEHLASRGMQVQTANLVNCEVQILARERESGVPGGAAEIKAQIGSDGQVVVDIDCVKGNRCEVIVQDFAQAIGGKVTATNKKSSYYQLPGEPAKTDVQV